MYYSQRGANTAAVNGSIYQGPEWGRAMML
jgi:hypothetical protein